MGWLRCQYVKKWQIRAYSPFTRILMLQKCLSSFFIMLLRYTLHPFLSIYQIHCPRLLSAIWCGICAEGRDVLNPISFSIRFATNLKRFVTWIQLVYPMRLLFLIAQKVFSADMCRITSKRGRRNANLIALSNIFATHSPMAE